MRVRARSLVLAAVLAALVAAPLPGAAAGQDLEEARTRRVDLQRRLDAAARELADLEAQAGTLATERDALAGQLAGLEREIAAADERVSRRVRSLFKRGDVDPVMALITTEEPADALDRATVVVSLTRADRAASEVADAKRTEAQVLARRLEERDAELDAALVEQETVRAALRADLEQAAATEQRLEEEARRRAEEQARRRAAAEAARRAQQEAERRAAAAGAPVAAGRYACPVAHPRTFTDTWGAPRSGGRRHRGTDILAPYGTAVLAVTAGVVDVRGYGGSAGNWLILRGADGTRYWYLHLQRFTVGDGARVAAGDQIGTNGDTGNARGTPHVHFEQHPGGGGAVNPYPFLRRIC